MDMPVLAILLVGFTAILAIKQWFVTAHTAFVSAKMQELVCKLKEFDLDPRAGLVVCRGSRLFIHYMDPTLKKMLGSPACVDDLLPVQMRGKHAQTVAKYSGSRAGELPESLAHPLRTVPMLDQAGNTLAVKLIIGKLGSVFFQQLYYVVVQPSESSAVSKRDDHGSSTPA